MDLRSNPLMKPEKAGTATRLCKYIDRLQKECKLIAYTQRTVCSTIPMSRGLNQLSTVRNYVKVKYQREGVYCEWKIWKRRLYTHTVQNRPLVVSFSS